ncbi:MAG: 50S ribosomal protein L6 [Spirochaetota bacterium]|nr:MAG: 50S ribosomal protein L6 [Spirochaetota bacterium]
MSRIGKLAIDLPDKVEFDYTDSKVTVKGPKGMLQQDILFDGEIKKDGQSILLINNGTDNRSKAFYGLIRALIKNMVVGVSEGYKKTLRITGVGYKAQLKEKSLQLNLGFSHPIEYAIPEGITVEVQEGTIIVISGIDKQLVGQVATDIRRFKPPEPYKGKGIMYSDEIIHKKAGKTAVK